MDMASTGWWHNSSRSLSPDCITSSEFDIDVDTAAHSHISSIMISLTIPLTSDCISQMLATFEHSLVTQQPYHQLLTACTRSGYNIHFCSAIQSHIISSFLHHSQWIWQLDTGSVIHSQITYIISSNSYITGDVAPMLAARRQFDHTLLVSDRIFCSAHDGYVGSAVESNTSYMVSCWLHHFQGIWQLPWHHIRSHISYIWPHHLQWICSYIYNISGISVA